MYRPHSIVKPALFVPLRLVSYVILMGVMVFWIGFPGWLQWGAVAYSVATLALALGIAFEKKHRAGRVLRDIVGLQFLLEIAIESGVIHASGGQLPALSALFVLTLVSAALTYRLAGTFVMASLISAVYTIVVWLSLSGEAMASRNLTQLWSFLSSGGIAAYSVFLHLLVFYLVAFISGYLAEQISRQDEKLAKASKDLRKARLETDDILRHLNSGLLTIDSQGYIIYFNRSAERILGYAESSIRGRLCSKVFSERMPQLGNALFQAIEEGISHPRKQIDILDELGQTIPLGLSTSILEEESRELRGVIAIFSDLTEAKQLEAKVRAADRLAAVGELSASIAHEIRNPLAAISGSVEVLHGELQLGAENSRLMEVIVRESRRLNKILTDFLTFAGIDRPAYNKVELCHVLNDVVDLLRHHTAFSNNIKIELATEEPMAYVIGDEDLIRQLLQNLLINACEAIEKHPGKVSLKLSTDSQTGGVTLQISDSGPGINSSYRDKIFQPFFSTKKQGTGLGLAIVHRICTSLQLSIQVESEEGGGTTFLISFPPYRPQTVAVQPATLP